MVLIVNCGFAITPVPLRVIPAIAPLVELLLIVIWPFTEPALVGLNCTCNVKDCVGFKVTGKLCATMLNPAPEIVGELTVRAVVPVEVSVSVWLVEPFTVTLPKLRLAELTVNCGFGAVVPVPLRVTIIVLPAAELLLIVNWPLAVPVSIGLNCTCRVSDWLGFSVAGRLPPTSENRAPVTVAALTVTGAVPVEVSVSAWSVHVFAVTLPKFKLPALTVS